MQKTTSEVSFLAPLSDHALRVAIPLLGAPVREHVHSAWLLLNGARPWSDRGWRLVLAAAARRVAERSAIDGSTEFLLVALARESRKSRARALELEMLADRAEERDAPWSPMFRKVLQLRPRLRNR